MLDTLANTESHIKNLTEGPQSEFLLDVLQGLSLKQKEISPKYFYDTQGSHYFDEICALEEYYPYRSELSLLPKVAKKLAGYYQDDVSIVEFGAGALKKVKYLLDALNNTHTFVPIDIAGDFLNLAAKELRSEFPHINVHPIIADFTRKVKLPTNFEHTLLGFFPGSTIGNFSPMEAKAFLNNARLTLGPEANLLIGVDTKKSPSTLHQAYNDTQELTAKFNINLLHRMNRELSANFDTQAFEHYAFYNTRKGCIEMHLVSNKPQNVEISNQQFFFERGESIHTESSYKYNPDEFADLASEAGWSTECTWLTDDRMFSMHLLKSRQRGKLQ